MGHDHDHTHEPFDSPGLFVEREGSDPHRDFADRAFTVGIGGPVGSGKTALLQALCERLRDEYSLG
ncbi:MAG: urease accessory protein UreG, partial [Gemmatimonadetes bacterium]|nr:urease accessory protein UreG [Gemmatimonadota bacterium]